MNLIIRTKISDQDIKQAVFDFMDSHGYELQEEIIPFITKKLLPIFIKMPEIQSVILEYSLYAMQNDEDLVFDLLLHEIEEEVEINYSMTINRFMAAWFNSLRSQHNEERYEQTKGRTL